MFILNTHGGNAFLFASRFLILLKFWNLKIKTESVYGCFCCCCCCCCCNQSTKINFCVYCLNSQDQGYISSPSQTELLPFKYCTRRSVYLSHLNRGWDTKLEMFFGTKFEVLYSRTYFVLKISSKNLKLHIICNFELGNFELWHLSSELSFLIFNDLHRKKSFFLLSATKGVKWPKV